MAELKCPLCGGTIVQDLIEKARYVAILNGCHCARCGIKFQPNLEPLGELLKALQCDYVKP